MYTNYELDNTKFCYQFIITITKFVIFEVSFKLKHKKSGAFFAGSEEKPFKSVHAMVRTVQLLRHDAYCPIALSY